MRFEREEKREAGDLEVTRLNPGFPPDADTDRRP
jgi:hypothetical protein